MRADARTSASAFLLGALLGAGGAFAAGPKSNGAAVVVDDLATGPSGVVASTNAAAGRTLDGSDGDSIARPGKLRRRPPCEAVEGVPS